MFTSSSHKINLFVHTICLLNRYNFEWYERRKESVSNRTYHLLIWAKEFKFFVKSIYMFRLYSFLYICFDIIFYISKNFYLFSMFLLTDNTYLISRKLSRHNSKHVNLNRNVKIDLINKERWLYHSIILIKEDICQSRCGISE